MHHAAPDAGRSTSSHSLPSGRRADVPTPLPTPDEATAHTLLNCLLREVSGPERQAAVTDGHLLIRLPRADALLRVAVRRTSLTGAHRFRGPVGRLSGRAWRELGWEDLASLVARELTAHRGAANDEFVDQVRSSRDTVAAILAGRTGPDDAKPDYLASEQALLFGHRFHPAPKAHSGTVTDRVRYGPETTHAFPLRYLGVRSELVREEAVRGDALASVDRLRPVPDGYRLLPVHPWQFTLLTHNQLLRAALADGRLRDLGSGGPEFVPTASVRTLAGDGCFLKFSLGVRITNCVRKNAWYELSGAVALTRILAGPARETARRHPGFALLPEPAYRTVDLGDKELLEGFGVIVREGVDAYGPGTPLLAAAVADEYPVSAAHVSRLIPDPTAERVGRWWRDYLDLLVPPVLTLFFEHGVVLEPHLQNVLVCVDDEGRPVRMLFRDLEGTKLLADRYAADLAALPADVAGPMTYDADRGWNRVVYCLLVNHVGETAAALADLCPAAEAGLWGAVRAVLLDYARRHGCPARLEALLSGAPLPAKANLMTRWHRSADREAGYVPVPSPLGAAFLTGADRRGGQGGGRGIRQIISPGGVPWVGPGVDPGVDPGFDPGGDSGGDAASDPPSDTAGRRPCEQRQKEAQPWHA
ncbi:iron transporter [Yinghuangia sp. ASG 101]|uniref:IucA/IucC family protein n=1 Tax=Yinghuangia sp. ASG 101 TaxID=2896848 RepID=UPI001E364B7A|nr:IucA/IucC family protein [Yinghuangia sp. ASG 101]UGQ10892.1 iron transporter [Yinghuangia sp. ASG 101]